MIDFNTRFVGGTGGGTGGIGGGLTFGGGKDEITDAGIAFPVATVHDLARSTI